MQRRDNIMRQNPGIKVTEVVKQIASMWQSLTKDEKTRYKELAKLGKPSLHLNLNRQGKISHRA